MVVIGMVIKGRWKIGKFQYSMSAFDDKRQWTLFCKEPI